MFRWLLALLLALCLAARAQAAIVQTLIGTASGTGPSISITVPSGGIPAGEFIHVGVVETGSAIGTISDSASGGGSVYQNTTKPSGTSLIVGEFYSQNSKALSTGGTITYTLANSSDSAAITAWYASGIADPAADVGTTGKNFGNSAAPSVVMGGSPVESGELVVGIVGWVGSGAFTQDTTNGGYSTPPTLSDVSTVVNIAGGSLINGTGTLTYAPSISVSGRWAAIISGFEPSSPPTQSPHTLMLMGIGK